MAELLAGFAVVTWLVFEGSLVASQNEDGAQRGGPSGGTGLQEVDIGRRGGCEILGQSVLVNQSLRPWHNVLREQ